MYFPSYRRAVYIHRVEDLQVFFFLWKSCRYSSSYGKAASIFLPIGELHIIFFLKESWRYFLHIGELCVFFFVWKNFRYSSSFPKSFRHSSCGRAAGILLPVDELQVFFFLRKVSRKFSSFRKAGGNFLHIGELYVFFFVYKICRHCSSCGRAAATLLPIKELQVYI